MDYVLESAITNLVSEIRILELELEKAVPAHKNSVREKIILKKSLLDSITKALESIVHLHEVSLMEEKAGE